MLTHLMKTCKNWMTSTGREISMLRSDGEVNSIHSAKRSRIHLFVHIDEFGKQQEIIKSVCQTLCRRVHGSRHGQVEIKRDRSAVYDIVHRIAMPVRGDILPQQILRFTTRQRTISQAHSQCTLKDGTKDSIPPKKLRA